MMDVSLVEVTRENVDDVLALEVAPDQATYVATNAKSIAQAHFEPRAWYRAIAAGDDLVGFAMVYRDQEAQEFYLWRFMIDARFQGRGHGLRAMELLLDEARQDGADEVTLNVLPGEHSALEFYRGLGFEETGDVDHGQLRMRLSLADRPA
jgi:diamine N-acetyltransferase